MRSISKSTLKFFQTLMAIVMIAGMLFPPATLAYAQDIIPPTGSGEEAPAPEATAEPEDGGSVELPDLQTVEAPPAEPVVIELPLEQTVEAPPEAVPTEVPLVEQTVIAPTEVNPAAGSEDGEGEEEDTPGESLVEIVELLNETNTILVDENDEPIPLVSEEAAEILEGGVDPFFQTAGGTWIAYTSTTGRCPNFVLAANCNKVADPLTSALADANLTDGLTLYIESKTYDQTVDITHNINLQAVTVNNGNGNVNYNSGSVTISTVNLKSNIGSLTRVNATNVNVFATGDAVINGYMLDDALNLVAASGTVTLNSGTYQDENDGFLISKNGVTLQGQGDSTVIDGDGDAHSGDNGNGIKVTGDDVKIKKLKVINSYDGIEVDSEDTYIEYVTLTDNVTGLHATRNADDITIRYSNIFGNSSYGIYSSIFTLSPNPEIDARYNYWGPFGAYACWDDFDDCSGNPLGTIVYDTGKVFNINLGNQSSTMYCQPGEIAGPDGCVKIVNGCMDSNYLEYNPAANVNDGSCNTPKVFGCTNPAYQEYNPAANSDDESCATLHILGCTDPAYQEYNSAATKDNETCANLHILGCTDPNFVEYDTAATKDDSSCLTPKVIGCMDSGYLEYNPGASVSDPSKCVTPKIEGCTDAAYQEYNSGANYDDGSCATLHVLGCTDSAYMEYDPSATMDDETCSTLKIFGCTNTEYMEFDPSANMDDGTCTIAKVYGCMDSSYVEFDPAVNSDDGTCTTPKVFGCTDSDYVEFDSDANTDDGTCVTPVVFGCMDSNYLQYNSAATVDDGSCKTVKVVGCMNWFYLEFNFFANVNDQSMCVTPAVIGCLDPNYLEYNPAANLSNGSCVTPVVRGCMDPDYKEYNSLANVSDGSCETFIVRGCTDPLRTGYNPLANEDDGSCGMSISCPAGYFDANRDGVCDKTVCKPGFNDANSDGVCVATICPAGTNDDDADGYCEDDKGGDDPFNPFGGPFGPFNVLGAGGVIPVTGGLNRLSCTEANTLVLASGNSVAFSAPLCGYQAGLTEENKDALPAPLPAGFSFGAGMTLNVQKGSDPTDILPSPVTDTLTFVVPDELKDKTFTILFWDAAANGGLGAWVEIPAKITKNGAVVSAPLTEGDDRQVISGVEITAFLTGEATLNFTGTFILAYK